MAETKILVVEDDTVLLETLKYNLIRERYEVITAQNGVEALDVARKEQPGLVLLDLMLPELNGFEVCRILRKESNVPIIILTARSEEVDKIVGLEIGADDYITKPFSVRELLARIHAMLRRSKISESTQAAEPSTLKIHDLEIDIARHQVFLHGTKLELSPKEFDLLAFLARNKGILFSRDQLLEKVWGYEYAGETRTVDVHIHWLRQKIEAEPTNPKILLSVKGVGYKLEG